MIKSKTIGILGGGQLARMLAIAAGRLGFQTTILDPQPQCPARQFASQTIIAGYDNTDALDELAEKSDVVTYEFENIPAASIAQISSKTQIFPRKNALEISQDRLVEKKFIQSIGLSTAAFSPVASLADLKQTLEKSCVPAIIKTRRFGYDGKGQMRISNGDLKRQENALKKILNVPCILEDAIDFDCEISIIGARDRSNNIMTYEPARNVHHEGILSTSTLPCGLSENIIEDAKRQTSVLLNALDYVGVIGVEFFVTRTNELLINEFAPRVHNSGHWTEAACSVSQFEQHIRAISDLPLAETLRHSDCKMTNLIGKEIRQLGNLASLPNTMLHDYGKQEIRPGRKMGHYTTLSPRIIPE